jgi:hypothetical protein
MAEHRLLLVEATGIQDYIFGSNELKQHIGASELVQRATQDWVYELLPAPNNVKPDRTEPDGWLVSEPALDSAGWRSQVVYSGGGNAVVMFASREAAIDFTRSLTGRALRDAPGLGLVVVHHPFDPASSVLRDALTDLREAAAARKRCPAPSVPLLGLGVTAACVFTGAPAVGVDERRFVSAEVKAKLLASIDGRERLRRHLRDLTRHGYDFVINFDDFTEKRESSHMAVIHTDGIGMGKRVEAIGSGCGKADMNAEYARRLFRFSESIKAAAGRALSATAGMLVAPDNLKEGKLGGFLTVRHDRIPFRPIVFGGDDVTFVCEGHLGLSLAARYLSEFSKHRLSDGKPAAARAGVAVVKSHYPFARAYDLAEELCGSAKKRVTSLAESGQRDVPVMDWHFAIGGLISTLEEIRKREYQVRDGALTQRPVRLDQDEADWRSWWAFREAAAGFREDWAERRNKVKALREALRRGPAEVQVFLARESLPKLLPNFDAAHTGWDSGRCVYYDAVEALDFYVPLYGEP